MMFVHFRQVWLFGIMAGAAAISGFSQELNPRFLSARASGTAFVMELAGIGDDSCVLEATDDLPGSWTQVALPGPLTNGELEVPVDRPQRFFRIRCGAVYSANRAGYVELELTERWHLIANPFDNGGNTLPEVLGEDWPFGIALYQFDPGRQAYSATQFGRTSWLSDVQTMLPGTGAFIGVITPATLVLGGLFDDSVIVPELVGGWNLVGQTPASSPVIDGQDGDSMLILADNVYVLHVFEFGEWAPPVLAPRLGEGFWYHRNGSGAIPPAGGCLLFSNFVPAMGSEFGAPQFDHVGCLIEGTNWLAQLYAGPDAGALAGVGEPVTFLSGDEAGFFNTGSNAVRYVESVTPGGLAVVQIKMWMASSGATFEEARANGGPTGMTTTLSVFTSGGGVGGIPPSLPAGLVGLTSSGGLGSVIPDVSGGGSYFVGDTAQLTATYDYVTSRTVTYQWQRGTPEQFVPDDSGGWIWIPGSWVDIDGATGPVLEMSPIRFEDADHYRVWLHIDGCSGGGVSFPVELQVLPTHSLSDPSIDPATGAFRFVLEAESTFDFIIEHSSDFVVWNPLRTVVKPVGPVEITDTGAPGNQQRFYRARALTPP